MANKKILIGTIALIIVIAIAGFFGLWQINKPEQKALTPVSVQLRWTHWAGFMGMQVAREKGFYEDVGLDVEFLTITLDQPIPDGVESVISGKAHFSEVNALEALEAFGRRHDIKAVMAMMQTSPHAFAALADSGITSPADFKGKTLGVIRDNATGNLLYPALMERVGINPKEANIIPIGFDVISVLKEGVADVVDVFRNNQPYGFDQAGLEYTLIFPEQYDLGGYEEVIIATERLIEENPELVRTFVEATILGWEYAFENPEESVDITISLATEEFYQNRAYEEFAYGEVVKLVQPTGGRTIGHMDFQQWFNFYNVMESQGLIETEFEVRDMYTNEFIP